MTIHPEATQSLALAILTASHAPALLLDGDLKVLAASNSFNAMFASSPVAPGTSLAALGAGEWNVPQLQSLLRATLAGHAEIEAYEMDLQSGGQLRNLILNARRLEYGTDGLVLVMLTILDATHARLSQRLKDDLIREKAVLLQELQHRVANSLQIIASVLMQSARRVQSEEARGHLRDAHQRVMSIAKLQQQLSASQSDEVGLRDYLTELCDSLGASMIHDHDQISLSVDADDSRVGANISVILGLIVTELVINAMKHAFPDRRKGTILVEYHSALPNWTLAVSDDGVGTAATMAAAKPGLGTSIVDALAHQLDANVEVESVDPGTKVSITTSTPRHAEARR
ncbi:sensor histidine kinase [Segnochrobactrum spirostomi]|nr:sensor histidine kinase [Segnochrobactrum spirostomi]